jgi:ribosome-binding factor A
MSVKSDKIASLLQGYAAEFFEEFATNKNLITVVACDSAADGKSAVIWLSVYGPDKEVLETAVLRKAAPLRKYFASKIKNRYVPFVTIKLDTGGAHATRISELTK